MGSSVYGRRLVDCVGKYSFSVALIVWIPRIHARIMQWDMGEQPDTSRERGSQEKDPCQKLSNLRTPLALFWGEMGEYVRTSWNGYLLLS